MILVVADLDAAAQRILDDTGLASAPGGRHKGLGTGNRIVPLGPDYIELMAIVDPGQAAGSPLGRWVQGRLAAREGIAAFCLSTDNIDAVARRLDLTPEGMERAAPDGSVLGWRLAGLEAALADPCKPFFIQWEVPPARHPGRMAAGHRVEPLGLSWVEVSGDPSAIEAWIDNASLDIRVGRGGSGIVAAGVRTTHGDLVLR